MKMDYSFLRPDVLVSLLAAIIVHKMHVLVFVKALIHFCSVCGGNTYLELFPEKRMVVFVKFLLNLVWWVLLLFTIHDKLFFFAIFVGFELPLAVVQCCYSSGAGKYLSV